MTLFATDKEGYYTLLKSTAQAFGDKLVSGKAKGDWTLIARYPKNPRDGDGQDVEVYCASLPAEFFLIRALETPNSVNDINSAFQLSTGSGVAELVAQIADAISRGMLGLNTDSL